MEIKLAKSAGFCMGVRRAVDTALEITQSETGRKIFTYGPLIHNPQTIELFKSRGVQPVNDMEEIEDKKNAVLIIRAHGIAPEERKRIKASGVKIIDCTCPKVGYVQAIIKKHNSLGYTLIIVGDKEHPEVNALLGYAGGRGIALNSLEEVDRLPALKRVCVVAQTTQTSDDYEEIVEKIRKIYPDAVVFNTICSSTQERQAEVVSLARAMDAVIIVGGRNSANTKRLADLAARTGTPAYQIETAAELENIDLQPYEHIGVSAGASTPNWIIDQVIDKISSRRAVKSKVAGALFGLWVTAIKTDVYSAFGAACLCAAGMILQGLPIKMLDMAIAAFFVYGMHVINRLIGVRPLGFISSFREESYLRHPRLYRYAAIISLVAALALSFLNGLFSFMVILFMSGSGVLYNMKILPGKRFFSRLKDLPGSKNIFMAAAWGAVTAMLPGFAAGNSANAAMFIAFGFAFGIVFIRSAMSDILEMQSDKLIGRETIPVVFGKARTKIILNIISLALLFLLFFSYFAGRASSLALFLPACVLYMWICLTLCDRKSGLSGVATEGLLETVYIIAGLCVVAWSFF